MEIQDIRRARLAELIQRYGSQAKFIDETGENQSEISRLLRDKSFGERKARKLEVKCNLPSGWFDRPPGSNGLSVVAGEGAGESQETKRPGLTVVERVEPQWMALVYVTERELNLLSAYRRASDIGKSLVETAAESAAGEESGAGTAHHS